MYNEEQKSRIQRIVKHIWCLSCELYPNEIKTLDSCSQVKMRQIFDRELFEEINKTYLGNPNLPILDKCLDILGFLDQYNSMGRPNFSAFREWFYFKTVNSTE